MSEDKKFQSKEELEAWLKDREIDDDDAVEAAAKLFAKNFNKSSRLLGVSIEFLQGAGIEDALAMELRNKLKDKNPNETELLHAINSINFSCVNLGRQFLNDHQLTSYCAAALACSEKSDVTEILKHVVRDHPPSEPTAAPFTAIIAPTGTGKTQLAATASVLKTGNVRYVLCDAKRDDETQAFYKPHKKLAQALVPALLDFQSRFQNKLDNNRGANVYKEWFESEEVKCPLATLVHSIIVPSATNTGASVSFSSLQGLVKNRQEPLLFFMDEIPAREDEQHHSIMLFRDILRALHICPILMSTHSGAQNAVTTGSGSSSTDDDPYWCSIITRLPGFHTSKPVQDIPYLFPSERPLIATYLSEMDKETTIDNIVSDIQTKIQIKKPTAWTGNPIFQLCQLFRSEKDESSDVEHTTYALVGQHFGHLVAPKDPDVLCHHLKRSEGKKLRFRVQMVVPSKEPVLFTALTSWSSSPLASPGMAFPLVDSKRVPISVRAAFDLNSHLFRPNISTQNPAAVKLNGDLLEVTALASVCLASMNRDNGVGTGICLPKFLACVYHFMQEKLDLPAISAKDAKIREILRVHSTTTNFAEQRVPCCSSADSPFPRTYGTDAWCKGKLKRPRDAEQRDGWVGQLKEDGEYHSVLQIECKNYFSGVNKDVFGKVVKRVRPICPVTILFASSLNNIFASEGSWDDFIQDILLDPHEIAFLAISNSTVYWLAFEQGSVSLAPTDATTHLFVVIETGTVK